MSPGRCIFPDLPKSGSGDLAKRSAIVATPPNARSNHAHAEEQHRPGRRLRDASGDDISEEDDVR
jgi:hypothetical protein